jgi:type IV pilus assembly protein PilC
MPQFKYTVVDPTGKRYSKIITADDKNTVIALLRKSNLYVVEVKDATKQLFSQGKNLSTVDKIFFTQNIAVLLSSGVSLGEALSIIAEDTANKAKSTLYEAIRSDLESGYPLSTALSHYPNTFDPIYLSLVKAGESSGELDTILNSLAKSLEKDARTKNQVKSAFVYPALILASLVGLSVVLVVFVLPKLTKVFEDLRVELPITTRILVGISSLVTNNLLVSGILFVGIIVGGIFLLQVPAVKDFAAKAAHKFPYIKNILLNSDLVHLSSTLALLLNAGVPIQNALDISAGTVGNPRLQNELKQTVTKISTGRMLSQSLRETSLPKTFVALIGAGEQSGKIASIMETLNEHYQELLDTSIKNFTALLEPALTLIVGLVVGGVVISVLLPIYQFIGNLQSVVK